jgi:hypothetical protein
MIKTEQIKYELISNQIVVKIINTSTVIALIKDSDINTIVFNVEFVKSLTEHCKEYIIDICKNFEFHLKELTENLPKLYYIQNGYIGNAILWWRINSKGYTTDIKLAHKFTEEEAIKIISNKEKGNFAWECKHVDKNEEAKKLIIDGQYLNQDFKLKI